MNKKPKKSRTTSSLEQQLKWLAFTLLAIIFVLILSLMHLLSFSPLIQITLLTALIIPATIFLPKFYHKIINPFYRLTNLVEAIRLEDYSLRLQPKFNQGIVHTLSQEISALSDDLQQRKQQYDQHTLLIYHLIEQLDTPIAIFDSQYKLSHANGAFSHYLEQPWQSQRLASSSSLGLTFKQKWQFTESNKASQWQIKQSQFVQDEQTFHLVVLTNVEKLLRSNQQKSWQQIIRVLSHEIRNSLTPIKSLAQTMVELPQQNPQSATALQVIVERSTNLQEFVNRYSDISKNLTVNKSYFNSREFIKTIVSLFPNAQLSSNITADKIYADAVLLKQVLINLIKNGIEASSNNEPIEIKINICNVNKATGNTSNIEIIDHGHGIANTDNLFVPFYTTKQQGQGIGLGLCQNIIEQHKGSIKIKNNTVQGATAIISLPYSTGDY